MLTQSDAEWIRNNRAEITAGRTESITYYRREQTGIDQYTGEPVYRIIGEQSDHVAVNMTHAVEAYGIVDVVWKEIRISGNKREMIGGVEVQKGDARVTFPPDFDFTDIESVEKNGVLYAVIAYDQRGIGGKNRYEALVRRVA